MHLFIQLAHEQPKRRSRGLSTLTSKVTQRKALSILFVCSISVAVTNRKDPSPLLTPVGEREGRSRFYFYELEKGLRLMCFDCSLPSPALVQWSVT